MQSERQELARQIEELRIPLMISRLRDDEDLVILQLKIHLLAGMLPRILGVPPIRRARFEFQIGCGRVDLALFHADGSASLVEAKAGGPARDLVAGIGQLFLYETQLQAASPRSVRKILCAPAGSDHGSVVARACSAAGVKFVFMAPFATTRDRLALVGKGVH